jgi:hypothetical protein
MKQQLREQVLRERLRRGRGRWHAWRRRPYDWSKETPELRLPAAGHVRNVTAHTTSQQQQSSFPRALP